MSGETFAPRTPVRWREIHPPGSQRMRSGVVVEHQLSRGLVVIATHGDENACFEIPQEQVERWKDGGAV